MNSPGDKTPEPVRDEKLARISSSLCQVHPRICHHLKSIVESYMQRWTEKEEMSFQEVKIKLTQAPVMACYSQGAHTRLKKMDSTEQSTMSVASSTMSRRDNPNLKEKPWGSGGRTINFEVCTDHKSLITVFGAKSKPPSARIERWLLYLQQFKYKITRIPGRKNAADVISRLPVNQAKSFTCISMG